MAAERFPCTRLGAGAYKVTDPATGRTCTVYAEPMLDGRWIARADWDALVVIDPVLYKRTAVEAAREILAEASA